MRLGAARVIGILPASCLPPYGSRLPRLAGEPGPGGPGPASLPIATDRIGSKERHAPPAWDFWRSPDAMTEMAHVVATKPHVGLAALAASDWRWFRWP